MELKQSGATIVSTEEISEAFMNENKELMSKKNVDDEIKRNNESRLKAIKDQEVLVKSADFKSRNAVMLPKQYGAGTITKKMLFPLSIVVTVSELSSATMQSMESNSVKPLKKELTKQVNG